MKNRREKFGILQNKRDYWLHWRLSASKDKHCCMELMNCVA